MDSKTGLNTEQTIVILKSAKEKRRETDLLWVESKKISEPKK